MHHLVNIEKGININLCWWNFAEPVPIRIWNKNSYAEPLHVGLVSWYILLRWETWYLLSGEPDYFGRNKISSGGDLSHYSSASLY